MKFLNTIKKKIFACISLFLIVILIAGSLYFGNYYHSEDIAIENMRGNSLVNVNKINEGYFFDGPSNTKAIVFYPGAKVETTAYAPMLLKIAEEADVFLLNTPLYMAIFDVNKADKIINNYKYEEYFVAGHSMGGAVAGMYAANNLDKLKGVIFFAAYPTKSLQKENFSALSIYGTNDMNPEALQKGKEFYPKDYKEIIIEGGNHAQFGNYGIQKGDGNATISADEQQNKAVESVKEYLTTH